MTPTHIGYRLLTALLLAVVIASPAAAQTSSVDQLYEEFIELSDVMMTNGLRAPTRQEMFQRGVRAVHKTLKTRAPELAKRISDAKSDDEFRKILTEAFGDKPFNSALRLAFLQGSVASEGASVTPLENLTIQRQLRDNLYVGIGIQIAKKGPAASPTMPRVFPGGPARKAKARDGDKILAVDGVGTDGLDLGEVVQMLRGERGTDVRVKLQTGDAPPREVTMTRDVVPIDSVEGVKRNEDDSWDFSLRQKKEVAYLKILELKGSTVSEFRKAARRIEREGHAALVLDLTNVRGGQLRHAIMLSDLMIGSGVLGQRSTRTGLRKIEAKTETVFRDLPIAVLISSETRRAGEFVAAALKDRGRARLIGVRTGGDGRIESEIDLDSGYALRLTTGEMFRANGKPIQLPRTTTARTTVERSELFYRASQVGGVFPHVPIRANSSNLLSAALKELQSHLEGSVLEKP